MVCVVSGMWPCMVCDCGLVQCMVQYVAVYGVRDVHSCVCYAVYDCV